MVHELRAYFPRRIVEATGEIDFAPPRVTVTGK